MKTTLVAITLALAALPGWSQGIPGAPGAAGVAQCNALGSLDLSTLDDAPTQIVESRLVGAKGDLPAFCEVRGYVTPNVGFKIELPVAAWNGKFVETGCGGSCGSTDTGYGDCEAAARKGYACVRTDTGHRGGGQSGQDGLWAYNNLQAHVDFGYRAAHVAALAGKAIAGQFYGRAPAHSYFSGCSTGGRQALIEAQRFPWDFDGIIAGAPGIDETDDAMDMAWALRALNKDRKPLLSQAELELVHQAALARCDMDDGVKDGIIGNPLACRFDPAELVCRRDQKSGCLTKVQADAVKKVYAGPTNSKGERIFVSGAMPGSELNWENWLTYSTTGPNSTPIIEAWATEFFRYMVMPALGAGWTLADFDFDRDYKRIGSTSRSLWTADNPDLRKFKSAGGKLIMYQGWNDPLGGIPEKTIDYYQTTEKTMGGRAATQSFARLFMIPGMKHCAGGEGATVIDYLGYLEDWVEAGKAPDKLIGARLMNDSLPAAGTFPLDVANIAFTRPVYPYPLQAKYKGSGDPNKEESFLPVESDLRRK
jgi:feruloyl esterase